MSYFLWVEDFENEPEVTIHNVFGEVVDTATLGKNKYGIKQRFEEHGIFVELNFQDGLEFIRQKLRQVDYIILDIDLPAYGDSGVNERVLELLRKFEGYQSHEDETEDEILQRKGCEKLKKIAGFYLYTQLVVEIGFPKKNILFCSNHGKDTISIQNAFKTAKIDLPIIHEKSKPEVSQWVKDCYGNPYSILRRGIIQACEFLKDKESFFGKYSSNDKKPAFLDKENYLTILSDFLPICEPVNTFSTYKLLVRTLAHEWDQAVRATWLSDDPVWKKVTFAFSWIMKITRNWSAHGNVFDELRANDVAFLFIVNMRAMFDLGEDLTSYEKHLFKLFASKPSKEEFKIMCGKSHEERQIPLIQNYVSLIDKHNNNYEALNFHDLLNDLQKNKYPDIENEYFVKGLYQVFWFLTSNGSVYIPRIKSDLNMEALRGFRNLNYRFQYFDYKSCNFIFELARHIYHLSFTETRPNDHATNKNPRSTF